MRRIRGGRGNEGEGRRLEAVEKQKEVVIREKIRKKEAKEGAAMDSTNSAWRIWAATSGNGPRAAISGSSWARRVCNSLALRSARSVLSKASTVQQSTTSSATRAAVAAPQGNRRTTWASVWSETFLDCVQVPLQHLMVMLQRNPGSVEISAQVVLP